MKSVAPSWKIYINNEEFNKRLGFIRNGVKAVKAIQMLLRAYEHS